MGACVVGSVTFPAAKHYYRKLTGKEEMIVRYVAVHDLNVKATEGIRKKLKLARSKKDTHAILVGVNVRGGYGSSIV